MEDNELENNESQNDEKVYQELYTEYIIAAQNFKKNLIRAGIAAVIVFTLLMGTMVWAISRLECTSVIPYTSVNVDVK